MQTESPVAAPPRRLLPLAHVMDMTGFSGKAIANRIKAGQFPPGLYVSAREKRWLEADIVAWIDKLHADAQAGRVPEAARAYTEARRRGGLNAAQRLREAKA